VGQTGPWKVESRIVWLIVEIERRLKVILSPGRKQHQGGIVVDVGSEASLEIVQIGGRNGEGGLNEPSFVGGVGEVDELEGLESDVLVAIEAQPRVRRQLEASHQRRDPVDASNDEPEGLGIGDVVGHLGSDGDGFLEGDAIIVVDGGVGGSFAVVLRAPRRVLVAESYSVAEEILHVNGWLLLAVNI